MAIFGFSGTDRDFRRAKKQRRKNVEQARALRNRQVVVQSPPQQGPATPTAAGRGTAAGQPKAKPEKSRPVTQGRYKQAQANTPVMVEPRQPYNDPNRPNQPQEVGTRKTGSRTITAAPSTAAEAVAQEQIKRQRGRVSAAKEELAQAKPRKTEFGDAASRTAATNAPKYDVPQVSTANEAEVKANVMEQNRLAAIRETQGADTDAGKATQAQIDDLKARNAEIAGETKPSLKERRARTQADIAQGQAAQREARVDAARTQAERAGTATGRAVNAAGEVVDDVAARAADTPRNKATLRRFVDATKQAVPEGVEKLKETGRTAAQAVQDRLQSSQAPGADAGDTPEAPSRTKKTVEGAKNVASKVGQAAAKTGATLAKPVTATYGATKAAIKNPLSPKVAGPVAAATAIADIDQYVRQGGKLGDLPGEVVSGLEAAYGDEMARFKAIEEANKAGTTNNLEAGLFGLASGASNIAELGLNAGEAVTDLARGVGGGISGLFRGAPIEGFRQSYDQATGERGFLGRSADYLDRETGKLAETISGGRYTQPTPPPAEEAAPAEQAVAPGGLRGGGGTPPPTTTETLVPGSDQVGTTDFERFRGPPAPGGPQYDVRGPGGSFMQSQSPGAAGGGTMSVVSGPAGPGATTEQNVAAYDRQTNAIRDLRNAQRAAQGFGAVGTGGGLRGGGGGSTQYGPSWGQRQRMKNLMRDRPDYDPNLTPKQNNSRLANWQAQFDTQMVAEGIDPRSGAITGREGLDARFGGGSLRDQIALAALQQRSAKDAYDMQRSATELGLKLSDSDMKWTNSITDRITSGDPVAENAAYDELLRAFFENPGSDRGRMALQQFGRITGGLINNERGLIDWALGVAGIGEKGIPESVYSNPEQALALLDQAAQTQEGGLIPWRNAISTGGSNYGYTGNLPGGQSRFVQGMRSGWKQRQGY